MLEEISDLDEPLGNQMASEQPSKDDRVVKSNQNNLQEEPLSFGLTYDLLFGKEKSKVNINVPAKQETKSKEAEEFSTFSYVKDQLQSMRETLQLKSAALKEVQEREQKYFDSLLNVEFNNFLINFSNLIFETLSEP